MAKKRMEAELFKTAQPVQKIPFGTGKPLPLSLENVALANRVDPKTVLCTYFKGGLCEKGRSACPTPIWRCKLTSTREQM